MVSEYKIFSQRSLEEKYKMEGMLKEANQKLEEMKEYYEKLNDLHKQKLGDMEELAQTNIKKEGLISQLQTEIALKQIELKNKEKTNKELSVSQEKLNLTINQLREKIEVLEWTNKRIKEDYEALTAEHLKTISDQDKSFQGVNENAEEKKDSEDIEIREMKNQNNSLTNEKQNASPISKDSTTQKLLDDLCLTHFSKKPGEYSLVQLYNHYTCPYPYYFDPSLHKGGQSM